MKLCGNYSGSTSYDVGDVVLFTENNVAYCLQKAAPTGTKPIDTRYWDKLDQKMSEAVKLIMDAEGIAVDSALTGKVANNLTTTASGKVLDARQGKALKTLIDDQSETVGGLATSLSGLNPDTKTIRLASSTAESTKLFDITVDDDGELTATEYTPPEPEPEEEIEGGES